MVLTKYPASTKFVTYFLIFVLWYFTPTLSKISRLLLGMLQKFIISFCLLVSLGRLVLGHSSFVSWHSTFTPEKVLGHSLLVSGVVSEFALTVSGVVSGTASKVSGIASLYPFLVSGVVSKSAPLVSESVSGIALLIIVIKNSCVLSSFLNCTLLTSPRFLSWNISSVVISLNHLHLLLNTSQRRGQRRFACLLPHGGGRGIHGTRQSVCRCCPIPCVHGH